MQQMMFEPSAGRHGLSTTGNLRKQGRVTEKLRIAGCLMFPVFPVVDNPCRLAVDQA